MIIPSRERTKDPDEAIVCSLKRLSRDLSHPNAVDDKRAILAEMVWMEPGLSKEIVLAAIDEVVHSRRGLRILARQIRWDVDLLYGSSYATPIVYRFFLVLRRYGASNMHLPTCHLCWKEAPLVSTLRYGKRICAACSEKTAWKETCLGCRQLRRVAGMTDEGEPLCRSCNRLDEIA